MTPELEFMECDTCRAKPGSPLLCRGCIHNRAAMSALAEQSIPSMMRIRLLELYRDIGTVRSVSERRSNPDADHVNMLRRLLQWEKRILACLPENGEHSVETPLNEIRMTTEQVRRLIKSAFEAGFEAARVETFENQWENSDLRTLYDAAPRATIERLLR